MRICLGFNLRRIFTAKIRFESLLLLLCILRLNANLHEKDYLSNQIANQRERRIHMEMHERGARKRKRDRERERKRESMNSGRKYWFKTTKNLDISTGPRTCLFAHSLAPLTHLLALHGLLCLHVSLHSFICLLAHSFSQSQARWESE